MKLFSIRKPAAWTAALLFFAVMPGAPAMGATGSAGKQVEIVVYKDPDCGCCKNWVEYLRKHGFRVVAHDTPDMNTVKQTFGIRGDLQSCHTATVSGYVIEGHVPAGDIERLLRQRPKIAGIAVPGMPTGSPGMEGGTPERYQVIAFDKVGATKVFARH